MPNLFDTFRFTANDGTGDQALHPLVSGLKRKWERNQDGRDFRIKLSTPLLFKGADYAYFRAIYDAGDCTAVSLKIENKCGGTWSVWYMGKVPINDGEYNKSACEVTFEILPNDVYQCASKGFDKKANWLDYGTATEVKTFIAGGTIETYPVTVIVPSMLTAMKWAFTILDVRDNADPDPITQFRPITNVMVILPTQTKIITTLAREKVTSVSSPGPGWVNVSGTTWARPVIVSKITTQGIFRWEAQIINPAPISNGRKFADLLGQAITALDCDIDHVVSNFFGINPDSTNPSNAAYTYAAANFQHVFFFQKSDIVRASAQNDATRFETTLKEILDELKVLNLFWAITQSGGDNILRIEHYTYFNGSNSLDLTTYEGGKYLNGFDKFKTKDQVPAFEEFAYQESFRPKFLRQRIDYPVGCVNAPSIDRSTKLLCADFGGLIENQDAGLEGFFLIATNDLGGGQFILNTLGSEANGAFAWENMLPALWADGRYNAGATATVPGYAVTSVLKARQQGPIVIRCLCSLSFSAADLVRTQLGWGEVSDAEQDTERGTLTLNLLQ